MYEWMDFLDVIAFVLASFWMIGMFCPCVYSLTLGGE
jgi:hypothetical protein